MPELLTLFRAICEMLVDDPAHMVFATETQDDGRTAFVVIVNGRNAGQLIGKEGRLANALRTVMRAAAKCDRRGLPPEFGLDVVIRPTD